VKIVKDAEVAEVEGVDVVVTEKLTIPEVVAIAMIVGEFRKRTIETVGTVVFVGTRCRNVRNYNMNNGNTNVNRVKTKSIITFQIYGPRVVCQL
jgi:hypothetical protein